MHAAIGVHAQHGRDHGRCNALHFLADQFHHGGQRLLHHHGLQHLSLQHLVGPLLGDVGEDDDAVVPVAGSADQVADGGADPERATVARVHQRLVALAARG